MAMEAHGQRTSSHKGMAGAEKFVLLIITKETMFPREKICQIIVTSVIGAVGGDDGVGKVNIAPILRRMWSTGGGDTVEQGLLRGIVGDLIDRIRFKIRKLQDGVGITNGPI